MNKNIIVIALGILVSCNTTIRYAPDDLHSFPKFPLQVPEQNSLMAQWEKKPVADSKLIDDMEKDGNWKVTGIGEISYTSDRSKDGKRSLRFRTSLRDEEHYRKNRTKWDSFNAGQGGNASVRLTFDKPQDWSGYNRLSFWIYVHPTTMQTYCIYLTIQNEGTPVNATTIRDNHFVQDLKPGQWNHVMFEMQHRQRDKITLFAINQMLRGHNPEEEGIVTYDIDRIELQNVEGDQFEGWNVAPGKISFCHAGYRTGDPKTALAGKGAGTTFKVTDENGVTVFSGPVRTLSTGKGKFRQMDFSGFTRSGVYQLHTGNIVSGPFRIDDDIWLQPMFKAVNFYFCERCGYNVPGIHTECHKDWQGFRGDVKKIINGGWHDAGDLSQGSFRTAMSTLALMNNLEYVQARSDLKELADRLRDEIAWGVEWLLKTRFGDGYHMSFSVMRIYTDNKVGTIDDVVSPAENVPWENFLTAAVQCKAAMMLAGSHSDLAARTRSAAIEDWEAAKKSKEKWDKADYKEAAWGATSSLYLARMTGDEKYKKEAVLFGKLLLQCQEQSFVDGIPITGYFYENTTRDRVIHNLHASFEEAPLIALCTLCRDLPDNEDWIKWYSAAVLHSEFFMKRGSRIAAPYYNLPNSVWNESELLAINDSAVRADMMRQYMDGTKLKDKFVLRTFPIYRDNLFHGNTNILMSSTWALAEASRLRKDLSGMRLAGRQLEWVLGANPFGQSLMYGEGYDFAPHFAYTLKDIVGSLPVGMDCMHGDMPYWSATNDATSKEIWVEPVNRFLGSLAIYSTECLSDTATKCKLRTCFLKAETIKDNDGTVTVKLIVTGTGRHTANIRTFNSVPDKQSQEFELSGNKTDEMSFRLKVSDLNKPFIAVALIDNDQASAKEIVGSYIDSPW